MPAPAKISAKTSLKIPVISGTDTQAPASFRRLPPWLRREVPRGNSNHFTSSLLKELELETVCENAKCPNRMECYSQKTATFMILGNVCTRPCGFCAVARGRPEPLVADEPQRVAEAVVRLGLAHVVITSVTRDDLPDGGAEHYRQTVAAIRARSASVTIELLIPDFISNPAALDLILQADPDVLNHNTETVPRLYRSVRGPKSEYAWTLDLLRKSKSHAHSPMTKSGLMLGLGESTDEVLDVLADLLEVGCDFLTLGQYLQPSPQHLAVRRFLPPEEFAELGRFAERLGFKKVASGPFVRSSYHARDMAV